MNFWFVIVPIILVIASDAYINSCYKKYSNTNVNSRISGSDVARKILDENNLRKVKIGRIGGVLTDNFNSRTNRVSLSDHVYEDHTIASVAVAAHECGHVMQHKEKYFFIVLRSILAPVISFSSKIGYIVMVIGVFASVFDVVIFGLILMSLALVFQLITLPCEFDASRRAKKELVRLKIIDKSEYDSVDTMLRSAAFTYVASFFASLLQMIGLFLRLKDND